MKSVMWTAPVSVSCSVSRTSVSRLYRRRVRNFPLGASSQRPRVSSDTSAAKHAPESNRGRHSQSIEPFRPTSAAVWVSPISA
jgi:hypothetical protein